MPIEPRENLLDDARERAKRLVDDLIVDAADLRSALSKQVSAEQRREGAELLADAVRAAQRLHEALRSSK